MTETVPQIAIVAVAPPLAGAVREALAAAGFAATIADTPAGADALVVAAARWSALGKGRSIPDVVVVLGDVADGAGQPPADHGVAWLAPPHTPARVAAAVAAGLREVAVRLVAEQRLGRLLAVQHLWVSLGKETGITPEHLIGAVTSGLVRAGGYGGAAVYLRDGDALLRRGMTGGLDAALFGPARAVPGQGAVGRVFQSGVAAFGPVAAPPGDDREEIAVPIAVVGELRGVLQAVLPAASPLHGADLLLQTTVLEAAASQLGAMLERLAARAEIESRAAGLAALVQVGARITAEQQSDRLLATIDEQIARLIPSDEALILLLEPETGDLVAEWVRAGPDIAPAEAPRLPRGTGLAGRVVRDGAPLLTGATADEPRSLALAPLPGPVGTLGVISLARRAGPDFTPLDRELLAAFGQQIGVVIAQARLRAEEQRRVRELEALNAIAAATASLDLDRVLAELVPRLRALIDADLCVLVLRDLQGDQVRVRAADGRGAERLIGTTVPPGALLDSAPPDAESLPAWLALPEVGPTGEVLAAPLPTKESVIGALLAVSLRPGTFTPADRRFLRTAGAQAALAVQNARLYADTLRLSRYDPLTGLANRRYFVETLTRAVETAMRYERPLALLLIDLDHFKAINDTFGHLAGDALLRDVAARIRARLRKADQAARYAGDELAVILPETGLAGAMTVARHLRAAVATAPFPLGDGAVAELTLSIGVGAHWPGATVTDLLHAADSAMYFAKSGGRNRVCGPEAARDALARAPEQLATILRGGNQAVIEELAAAVDARLPHAVGQGARVAAVAEALGTALGLTGEQGELLRRAALVHDLGEVAVPAEVLGHPGPLSAWEWTIVRAHPRHGHELLAEVPAFAEVLPLILHHHEGWDGGGYPDGLVGEAIPQGARIIAVAAAWEALTNERPYRPALTPEAALAELRRAAGTQFDPQLVAALPRALAALGHRAARLQRTGSRASDPR